MFLLWSWLTLLRIRHNDSIMWLQKCQHKTRLTALPFLLSLSLFFACLSHAYDIRSAHFHFSLITFSHYIWSKWCLFKEKKKNKLGFESWKVQFSSKICDSVAWLYVTVVFADLLLSESEEVWHFTGIQFHTSFSWA